MSIAVELYGPIASDSSGPCVAFKQPAKCKAHEIMHTNSIIRAGNWSPLIAMWPSQLEQSISYCLHTSELIVANYLTLHLMQSDAITLPCSVSHLPLTFSRAPSLVLRFFFPSGTARIGQSLQRLIATVHRGVLGNIIDKRSPSIDCNCNTPRQGLVFSHFSFYILRSCCPASHVCEGKACDIASSYALQVF